MFRIRLKTISISLKPSNNLTKATLLGVRSFSMAQDRTSPFTNSAVSVLRRLYPETLADRSFDNTGLLLESAINLTRKVPLQNRVLLTIDLTTAVADEAIDKHVNLVVAYHPIIFKGLKSITMADSQQRSLLRLAAEGISVYSPHTAVDAVDGGNADWLLNMVAGRLSRSPNSSSTSLPNNAGSSTNTTNAAGHDGKLVKRNGASPPPEKFDSTSFPRMRTLGPLYFEGPPGKRSSIAPATAPIEGHPNAGMGRIIRFSQRQPLSLLLENLLENLGRPTGIKIAPSYPGDSPKISETIIEAVAVCAGSGGGVFRELKEHVDLLVTGEMSHHEVLAATEKGQTVVCLDHSNSERGYLSMVMRQNILDKLRPKWQDAEVLVSEADQDPFGLLTHNVL